VTVFVDSSVVLAAILGEKERPADSFWSQRLVASRLIVYEVVVRLNAVGATSFVVDDALALLGTFDLAELSETALGRALDPFSKRVRTLDALHLATACHLRTFDADLQLATFDSRMAEVAAAIGLRLFPLPR
jgi:predicted nucleic acid-binding protein